MANQDELVQVGLESTILEDSVAQENSFEGDHSLQPYPEVMGATASIMMLEDPPASNFPHGGPSDPYRIHIQS